MEKHNMSEAGHAKTSSQSEVKHLRWSDLPTELLNPLLDRQLAVGHQIMVARILLKKGCVVPMHSHMNEQVAYMLEGALTFTVNGEEIVVRAGELLCIPPNVPHQAVAIEDTVNIDIFTPPRADWINKTD